MRKNFIAGLALVGAVLVTASAASCAGSRVTFVSEREAEWGIYSAEVDGSDLRRVAALPDVREPSRFAWTADGSHIAFTDRGRLMKMSWDGRSQTQVTEDAAYEDPAWSPDGSRLAITASRDITGTTLFGLVKKKAKEIYVVNVNGTGLVRLTNNTADDYSPAWSPDGRKIAFASKRDGNSEIYVMNADGTEQMRVTNSKADDEYPTWSPDGQRLAYTSQSGGSWVIKTANTDGSGQTQISFDDQPCTQPAWAPDGNSIAYRSGSTVAIVSISGDYEGRSVSAAGRHTDLSPSWVWSEVGAIRPYQLSGRVIESATNRSVPNVRISFSNGRRSVVTDRSGAWWKSDLDESVTVTPSAEGWVFEPRNYQIVPDIDGRVMVPAVTFEGTQYYSARGSVIDAKGKGLSEVLVRYHYRDPLKKAEVVLYTMTDDKGEFTLADVTGTVYVRLQKDGWAFDSQEARIGSSNSAPRLRGTPVPTAGAGDGGPVTR